MQVRIQRQPLASLAADWLVVGVFEPAKDVPEELRSSPASDLILKLLAREEVSGGLGEMTPILGASGLEARAMLMVGLGPVDKFGPGPAFSAGVAIGRKLGGKPRDTVAVALPTRATTLPVISALVEGLIVGTQGTDLKKAEPVRHPFRNLWIVDAPDSQREDVLSRALERGQIVGQAVNLARTLANTPPIEKTPEKLAARAVEIAREAGLTATVHDAQWLRQERFGGVLGVSAGSDEPPTFVTLAHRGRIEGPPVALVGKGVTFDSGGLSLKPSASMEDMKSDMAGAAIVLATMQAVARLQLPIPVVASFALVENMTGGRAMKLGDVLTHRNGATTEVLNTDAEGRLILADVLSYAVEQRPSHIVDLATLTGACMVALGTRVAGLFSNDDGLAREVEEVARLTGERVWRMPLDDDYREQLKSSIADLKNVGGKWGGAITAAKFLQQFVGETPWAHLDIAGPSWAESESATRDAGATGCFVRTLVTWLESRSASRG
jgi:leucyl aminopeptidase